MIQVHPTVLIIISTIILGVIGTMLGLFIKWVITTQKELTVSIQKLNESLSGLNGMVTGIKDMNDLFTDGCKERHMRTDKEIEWLKEKVS